MLSRLPMLLLLSVVVLITGGCAGAAVAKGADIITIMEQAAIAWSIVSKPDIAACTDLRGRRVAITSTGSLNAALLNAYIQNSCPGTEPTILLIANSENRAAALMAGEIDAAPPGNRRRPPSGADGGRPLPPPRRLLHHPPQAQVHRCLHQRRFREAASGDREGVP